MKALAASLFAILLALLGVSAVAATPMAAETFIGAEPGCALLSDEDKDKDKDKDGGKKTD